MLPKQYNRTIKWLSAIFFLAILAFYFRFDKKAFGELVFTKSLNPQGIIYTINSDGSGATNLTAVSTSLVNPSLILQRLKILDYKRLPPLLKLSSDLDAQWSPDGSFLAYRSNAGDSSDMFSVYLLRANHTNKRRLTYNIDVYSFIWLNKSHILLEAASGQVYLLDAESTHVSPIQCLNHGFRDVSPDRSQVMIIQASPNQIERMPTQLIIVNLDCSKATIIAEHHSGICDAAWSPNGYEALFVKGNYVTTTYGGDNIQSYECNQIYRIEIDGSDQVRLDDNDYSSKYDLMWSPDGERIAFAANENYVQDIYLMNRDGSNLIRLTNSPAYDQEPTWSPLGDQVAFGYTDYQKNQTGILIYSLDDSKLRAIAINQYSGGSISWRTSQE